MIPRNHQTSDHGGTNITFQHHKYFVTTRKNHKSNNVGL